MIEGLKVTISARELAEICEQRAAFHANRAKWYEAQLDTLKAMDVPGKSLNPGEAAMEKIESHKQRAAEMEFVSKHLDLGEAYLLDQSDLVKLGIIYSRY